MVNLPVVFAFLCFQALFALPAEFVNGFDKSSFFLIYFFSPLSSCLILLSIFIFEMIFLRKICKFYKRIRMHCRTC